MSNTITDATDGAIVIFGAPGTLVKNNTIIADTRVLLGGKCPSYMSSYIYC